MQSIPNSRFLTFGYDATERIDDLHDILSETRIHAHANTLLNDLDDYRQKTDTVRNLQVRYTLSSVNLSVDYETDHIHCTRIRWPGVQGRT